MTRDQAISIVCQKLGPSYSITDPTHGLHVQYTHGTNNHDMNYGYGVPFTVTAEADFAHKLVNALETLGLLKLDEGK